jgi:hypothetical protein
MILDSLINRLFDLCVDMLSYMASTVGMTYKEINIWIFCIIEPIIFLLLIGAVLMQKHIINQYINQNKERNHNNK